MLSTSTARKRPWENDVDKVQTEFLREMAGVGRGVSIAVLLRDFHRCPLAHRWIKLACRWWTSLAGLPAARMAHVAWRSDIALMLDGCKDCWTYKLLSALTWLNILPATAWNPAVSAAMTLDMVAQLRFEETDVITALHDKQMHSWQQVHPNPRTAGEAGHEQCIHAAWVMPLGTPVPAHLKLCMPYAVMQCLSRFRLGQHDLESHVARRRRQRGLPRVPWEERWCKMCSVQGAPCEHARLEAGLPRAAEDLRHFLLECPAYALIRSDRFAGLFSGSDDVVDPDARVAAIFSADSLTRQRQLASCLMLMCRHRALLGLQAARAPERRPRGAVHALDAMDAELDRLGFTACPVAES